MIDIFQDYVAWRILRRFAMKPRSKAYVNELAVELELSAGSYSAILSEFEKEGILEKKILGRAKYYSLADTYVTRELRRFVGLMEVHRSGLAHAIEEQAEGLVAAAVYGSFAVGDFDEGSDLDVVIIASGNPTLILSAQENALGRDVNAKVFGMGSWLGLKAANDPFYKSVKANHVRISGGGVP